MNSADIDLFQKCAEQAELIAYLRGSIKTLHLLSEEGSQMQFALGEIKDCLEAHK